MESDVEEKFRQFFELATPEEIRAGLRKSAYFFMLKRCNYNDTELRVVMEVVNLILPIQEDYEDFNKRHPERRQPL